MGATVNNRLKDVNSIIQIRILVPLVVLAPPGVLLGWTAGGLSGVCYALAGSIVAALAFEFLAACPLDPSVDADRGSGCIDQAGRAQVLVILSQARFHRMSLRHDLALACIDKVLAADPDFPEAVFLKAQILWEGYREAAGAKRCLIRLMKTEHAEEAGFHRWAQSLYKEISGSEGSRTESSMAFDTSENM